MTQRSRNVAEKLLEEGRSTLNSVASASVTVAILWFIIRQVSKKKLSGREMGMITRPHTHTQSSYLLIHSPNAQNDQDETGADSPR